MKNKLKMMISKKVADRSHFGSNIESLFYSVVFSQAKSSRATSSVAYKCDACTPGNFVFTCLTPLRMHFITHMNGKTYHCTICGNSFSKSKHFVIHMLNHSLSNKCDICRSGNLDFTCLTKNIVMNN